MQIADYTKAMIEPMLDHPEALVITESQDQMGVLLTLAVHKEDMGVLIGKAGATANAIRLLVRIVGMRHNARVSVKFDEPSYQDKH